MGKVVCEISMSVDGFVAGPNMTEQKPFGDLPQDFVRRGLPDSPEGLLHRWIFDEPEKHPAQIADRQTPAGAHIMGRNMYGPKGAEYDQSWKGWWGDDPPFHSPVFVLTHRGREPIVMEGGTTYFFVTAGIQAAMQQAQAAAGEKPVRVSGGADVINQCLAAGLIDELSLHIVPATLGRGQRLFENVPSLHLEPISWGGSQLVTHIKYRVVRA